MPTPETAYAPADLLPDDALRQLRLPSPARVLALRACRRQQFADGMERLKATHPSSHVTAVAPADRAAEVLAAGADQVLSLAAPRYGLGPRSFRLLRRLRRQQYDVIAIPQMNADFAYHANVYRFALALSAAHIVLLPSEGRALVFRRGAFARFVAVQTLYRAARHVDVPTLLGLLVLAALYAAVQRRLPRRARDTHDGRRRVLHVITTLGVGGAQVQLAELVRRTPPHEYEPEVLVLSPDDGEFARQWLGTHPVVIRYAQSWPLLSLTALEIARLCRERQYDLVHTWLFVANVIGATGARLSGRSRVIASVRNSSLWKRTWYARWWFRPADVLAARVADVVTVNATPLVADHAAWALCAERRLAVVPNGLDRDHVVSHTGGAATWLRRALGIDESTPLVGTVGRLAPEKDHATWLDAFAELRRTHPNVQAVIVGEGECRLGLETRAAGLELEGAVHFMGLRSDSRRIIAGLDLFVLSSRIEGFANVLLEAAFLGVPAIATDVGAARDVLGAAGVVPPGDPGAIAAAMRERLDSLDHSRFHAAAVRRRVLDEFAVERTVMRWLSLYDGVLTIRRRP